MTGLVKIGVATDANLRVQSIQSESPDRLSVLGILPVADRREEMRLHRAFSWLRAHGEWFLPAPAFLTWIENKTAEFERRADYIRAELEAMYERQEWRVRTMGRLQISPERIHWRDLALMPPARIRRPTP